MMLALRKMPVSPCRSETINDRSRGLRCSSVHDEMNKSTTAARPSALEALVMPRILPGRALWEPNLPQSLAQNEAVRRRLFYSRSSRRAARSAVRAIPAKRLAVVGAAAAIG